MGRRGSFSGLVNAMAREAARSAREAERREKARQRELHLLEKAMIRAQGQAVREAKKLYAESRLEEANERNEHLATRTEALSQILKHTLQIDDTVSFGDLRVKERFRSFKIPKDLSEEPTPPDRESFLSQIPKPNRLAKILPGSRAKYESRLREADAQYSEALKEYQQALDAREERIRQVRAEYVKEKEQFQEKVRQRNQEIDEFQVAYGNGDSEAIVTYSSMVLERSEYPEEFPQEYRLAYIPESKELVIEYELPNVSVVPTVSEYFYVKSKDEIREKDAKQSDLRSLYQDVVAAVSLRSIHEVLEADQGNHIDVVVFNGFVQAVDPATGNDIRPHLVSVRTTKERFSEVNLSRVDKAVCLRNLGAQVSRSADQLQAVKPIVDFNMVDRRFVEASDVLADLESRPNLYELDPFEFENLISNLFDHLGFDTKQTQSSRDGGVDAIAFDTRPIVGGKVVIQAKRYKNTVGVAAVRDLYGTMINEGANKGILVSTSGYGPDAHEFANEKPIELIDGGGLLYLLGQIGVQAKIVFPDDTVPS
ncbi:MAG: restriction endonuclease [Candidatus Eisenbacteria bacterium]